MSKFISDEMAEQAIHWLMDNAANIGAAKRQAILTERYLKRRIALAKKASSASTVAGREDDAHASQEYLDASVAEAEAAGDFETWKAQRDARVALVEAWRSLTASARSTGK